MFGASSSKVHVVPNGVENVFFQIPEAARGPWLVCTVTITEIKRVLELAEAAVMARTPLHVIGQPYSPDDSYARRFCQFAKQHPDVVRYEGPIKDRGQLAQTYRQARGFTLLSKWESQSLAALEAAASGCPLLLSDLPWARSVFGNRVSYCPPAASPQCTAQALRAFYDAAPQLSAPPKPKDWPEVAQQLKSIYESVLS